MNGAALILRLRLWVLARGPLLCFAAASMVVGAVALAWLLPLRTAQADRRLAALSAAAAPAPVGKLAPVQPVPAAPTSAAYNLAQFQEVLGERRYVEQQVGTLFALAAKNGIVLSQGEYKTAAVRDGGFTTYQVNLPVKGSYGAIWQFAMAALRAIPFASLDDISFKRDSIGQSGVEARVRLTLYLGEAR